MSTLSTHILDISTGTPAEGVTVSLSREGETLANLVTNAQGRIATFSAAPLPAGRYCLTAETGAWFARAGRESVAAESACCSAGPVSLWPERREATLDGEELSLTMREFDLLAFLIKSPGVVFSRETLLQRVWGWDFDGGSRTVDVHVQQLADGPDGQVVGLAALGVGIEDRAGDLLPVGHGDIAARRDLGLPVEGDAGEVEAHLAGGRQRAGPQGQHQKRRTDARQESVLSHGIRPFFHSGVGGGSLPRFLLSETLRWPRIRAALTGLSLT